MSATGNEIVKLNQLKMYVKYASDEDVEGYLAPPFEGGDIEVSSDLIYPDDIDASVSDNGEVSISGTMRLATSINLNSAAVLFRIPHEYAPNEDITFTAEAYYDVYTFVLDTNGTVRCTSEDGNGYFDTGVMIGHFTNVTYTIDIPQSTLDGSQVIRLSQVKKYFGSGGGSGGGGSSSNGAVLFEGYEHEEFVFENNDGYTRLVIEGMDQGYQTRTIDVNPIDEGYYGNSNELQITIWFNANQVWITLAQGVCITKVTGYK